MQYRKIGNSDLEVSIIALGTWVFGGSWWGGADDKSSIDTLRKAIDSGINIIDTAPIYGDGRSESVIGKAIKGIRDNVIIATKCGIDASGGKVRANLSASFIREEVENSLNRLGIDTIDLYQCHWPDDKTPYEETFGEMKKLIHEGKIRYVGVSNFSKAQMKKALGIIPIVSNQVQYSILERYIEKDIIPFARENGISILAYGPIGGGILTGKYTDIPAFKGLDARNAFYTFYKEPFFAKTKDLVRDLDTISEKHNAKPHEAAINWVLHREEVAACLVGCRTEAQLTENLRAAAWEMSEEEYLNINQAYKRIFNE